MKSIKWCFKFYLLIAALIFASGCLVGVCITPISANHARYEPENAQNEGLTTTDVCYNAAHALYDYTELKVLAEYSDEYRVCEVAAGEYKSGSYLEISGVGLYQVRESADVAPGNIVIFFNNAERVDGFNKKTVKVRECSDEI